MKGLINTDNTSLTSLLLVLAVLLVPVCLPGQSNPRVESLTIADGLSQGMIYDIEQTDDGFLWIATKDGLNRYDGYRFEVFTNDPFNPFSIAGNDIELLFEDGRGNLWLGITGIGVDVLEKTSGKFLHLPFARLGMEGKNYWIDETPDGAISLTTPDKSLKFRWKEPLELAENNADLQAYTDSEPAPALLQNPNSATVVKDSKGRSYRVEQANSNFRIMADPQNGENGKPTLIYDTDGRISCLNIDPADNLWVGTSGYGLRKIKLPRQPFHHFLKGTSVGRICATDGVYLSFHGDARFNGKLDEAADRLLPVSDLPPNISQMYRAKNGALYVVGDDFYHNYLLVIKNGLVEKRQIDSLLSHAFTSIVEDLSGNIFATGGSGGLMRYEAATGNIGFADLSKPFGKNVSIFALQLDARQNLWLGTSHGLGRIQLTDLKFGENPIEITTDKFQTYRNDPAKPSSLRYNTVTSFCPDPLEPERWLWVSTKGGGLNLFDKNSGEFQHFTSQNSDLPNDVVYGILPDDTGNIWGSTNRGLFRLTVASPLPPPKEGELAASPSFGGGRGEARIYRFRTFRASDGLQDDEFNSAAFARTPDGRLFFGGVNGLTAFYPSEIEDRQTNAPVRLTGLKINNTAIPPLEGGRGVNSPLDRPLHRTESIRLDHDQNLVTLEFALLDFQNPKENRFRYRLEGVDPDWVEAGTSHAANYAHLRPGHYLFEVQGSVSGGTWSDPASLRITVLPPWWATWWAYGIYLLALAAAAWWLLRFRAKRQALERQLELEHLEATRLKEMDDFKGRFFTNITHEFRTPLTVILGMASLPQAPSEGGGDVTPPLSFGVGSGVRLNLIRRNAESLLRLINQILDLAKLESNTLKINYVQGDVLPYLRYVCESLQSYANSKNVMIRVESDPDNYRGKIVMDYDPERLLQIVHNLLSNAIKFTPSGGRVTLRAGLLNLEGLVNLDLQVIDTGAGIPAEDLPKIFDRFYQAENQEPIPLSGGRGVAGGTGIGLSLTQELVKAMGGEISVESEVGKGSTFTVRLPITHDALPQTQPLTPKGEPYPVNSASTVNEITLALPGLSRLLSGPFRGSGGLSHEDNPSILLIEDNPDVVEYLAVCLGENYQLDFAYNGRAGIEKALENIPDLIISDVMMPEKDGFEVCETLKNDERTSHIPIILLTARADAASRIAGLRRGADAYLSKPFHREELLAQLQVLTEKQRRIAVWLSRKEQNENPQQLPEAIAEEDLQIEDAFIQKVRNIVAENYADEGFGLPQLCQKIGMSRSQLFRKMTALIVTSPSDFIRSYRLQEAKKLLETGDLNVSEVAWQCGFVNLAHFSKVYQEEFGMVPSATNK